MTDATDAVVGMIPLAIGAGIAMRVIEGPRRPRPLPRRRVAPKRTTHKRAPRRKEEPRFLY